MIVENFRKNENIEKWKKKDVKLKIKLFSDLEDEAKMTYRTIKHPTRSLSITFLEALGDGFFPLQYEINTITPISPPLYDDGSFLPLTSVKRMYIGGLLIFLPEMCMLMLQSDAIQRDDFALNDSF